MSRDASVTPWYFHETGEYAFASWYSAEHAAIMIDLSGGVEHAFLVMEAAKLNELFVNQENGLVDGETVAHMLQVGSFSFGEVGTAEDLAGSDLVAKWMVGA